MVHLQQKENILEYLYGLHETHEQNRGNDDTRVQFTDVDIICDNGVVNVHSVVLIGRSSLFKEYFLNLTPCERDRVTVHLPAYSVKYMILAVYFLYTGKCIVSSRKQKVVYNILQDLNIDISKISSTPYSSKNETQVIKKPCIYHHLFDVDDEDDLEILNDISNDQHQEQETNTQKNLIPEKVQPSLPKQQQQSSSSSSSFASTNNNTNGNHVNLRHSLSSNNKPPRPEIQRKAIRVVKRDKSGIKIGYVHDDDEDRHTSTNTNTTNPPQPFQSSLLQSSNNNNTNTNNNNHPPTFTKETRQPFQSKALKVIRSAMDGFKVVEENQSYENDNNNDNSSIGSGKPKSRQSIDPKSIKVVRTPGAGVKIVDNQQNFNTQKGLGMKIIKVGNGIKILNGPTTVSSNNNTTTTTTHTNTQIPQNKGVEPQNLFKRHHSILMSDSETDASNKRTALDSSDSDSDFCSDIDNVVYQEFLKTQPHERVIFRECRVVLKKLAPEDDDKYRNKLIALQSQFLYNPMHNHQDEDSENEDIEMEENEDVEMEENVVVISEETPEPINQLNSNENIIIQSQSMNAAPDININSITTSASEIPSQIESTSAAIIISNSLSETAEKSSVQRENSNENSEEELSTSVQNVMQQSIVEEVSEQVDDQEELITPITTIITTTPMTNPVLSNEQTTIEIPQSTNSDVNQSIESSSTMNTSSNDTINNPQVLIPAPTTTNNSQSIPSVNNLNSLEIPTQDDQRNNNGDTESPEDSSTITKCENLSNERTNIPEVLEVIDLTETEETSTTSSNSLPCQSVSPTNNNSNNNGLNSITNSHNGTSQSSLNIIQNASTNPLVVQNNNNNNSMEKSNNTNVNSNGISVQTCDSISGVVDNPLNGLNSSSLLQAYFGDIFSMPATPNFAANDEVEENNTNNNNNSNNPGISLASDHIQQQNQLPYLTTSPMNSYSTEQSQQQQQQEENITSQQESQIHPPLFPSPESNESIPQQRIQEIMESSISAPLKSNSYFECILCQEHFTLKTSLDNHICFGD